MKEIEFSTLATILVDFPWPSLLTKIILFSVCNENDKDNPLFNNNKNDNNSNNNNNNNNSDLLWSDLLYLTFYMLEAMLPINGEKKEGKYFRKLYLRAS